MTPLIHSFFDKLIFNFLSINDISMRDYEHCSLWKENLTNAHESD